MVRCRKPPSQTWRTFLENHTKQLVSIDFFTVPTIRFQVLYAFLALAHDRRRILHSNVTAHPTAEWTGQQLRKAFPFAQLPRCLLRDRAKIFGIEFRKQVRNMGISEVLSAPRSRWQRAYVERAIGTIRRECLGHVIVFHESPLRRTLNSYFDYYHRSRTRLSLGKDSPEPRAVQPPEMGSIVAAPQVGGLHHRYERRATWKSPIPPTTLRAFSPWAIGNVFELCSLTPACIASFVRLSGAAPQTPCGLRSGWGNDIPHGLYRIFGRDSWCVATCNSCNSAQGSFCSWLP